MQKKAQQMWIDLSKTYLEGALMDGVYVHRVEPSFWQVGCVQPLCSTGLSFAEEAGIAVVLSQHRADNNAVLNSKWKAGFLASGEFATEPICIAHTLKFMKVRP
jgi:hypothetical protein